MTTHQEIWAAENYVSDSEQSWLRWYEHATQVAGHSLDGDNSAGNPDPDGYSVDEAYAAWEAGQTPEEYVKSFQI